MLDTLLISRAVSCRIRVAKGEMWAEFVATLSEPQGDGELVTTTPGFVCDLHGQDTISDTTTNWLSCMTSGALYAFRALNLPRKRLVLTSLVGSLGASGMQALAAGTTLAICALCEAQEPPLDWHGWQVEKQILTDMDDREEFTAVDDEHELGGES